LFGDNIIFARGFLTFIRSWALFIASGALAFVSVRYNFARSEIFVTNSSEAL